MVTSGELRLGWQGHQPLSGGPHHWRGQGWAAQESLAARGEGPVGTRTGVPGLGQWC